MSSADNLLNRFSGSLVAGAAGDALGYVVEFISRQAILARYGHAGITRYDIDPDWTKAQVSDDTQMTLFTAEGLLDARLQGCDNDDAALIRCVTDAYLRWYTTQTRHFTPGGEGLLGVHELWARRAPGNTCLSALRSLASGNAVDNTSKGCGGIMRVAPVALFAVASPTAAWTDEHIARIAGLTAFITHHHPLSTLSSAVCAVIIAHACLADAPFTAADYVAATEAGCIAAEKAFPGGGRYMKQLRMLLEATIKAAGSTQSDAEAVASLGEGWVAEETLAIALASVMRHPDDVRAALAMAVNHNGDSDSTGAVAGNIIGASLGYQAIPADLADDVELQPLLLDTATRLAK